MLVWQSYFTDLGRAYPMFALSSYQINGVPSGVNPVDLLPSAVTKDLMENKYPCAVKQLTPRSIVLFTSDGGQFRVNYPQPFSIALFDYLTINNQVTAFEFVGEKIKYGRLQRLLDNV